LVVVARGHHPQQKQHVRACHAAAPRPHTAKLTAHLAQRQQERDEKSFVPDLAEEDEQQARDKALGELAVTDDACVL
jgi:hypothetical protein